MSQPQEPEQIDTQPPPCADHADNELNCPTCSAIRGEYYAGPIFEIAIADAEIEHRKSEPR